MSRRNPRRREPRILYFGPDNTHETFMRDGRPARAGRWRIWWCTQQDSFDVISQSEFKKLQASGEHEGQPISILRYGWSDAAEEEQESGDAADSLPGDRVYTSAKQNPFARNNMAFRKKYGLPQAPAGDPVLMQLPRVVLMSMGEAGAAEIARRQLGKSLQKGLEVPLERQSLKMRPRLPEGFTRSNPRDRQKYIVTAYSIDGLEFCTAHGLSEDFGEAIKFDTLHQAEVHAERQRNLSRDGHSYDGDGYSSHVTYRVMPLSKFKR